MALIVEDGSGLNDANAYVSEEYVDTHHSDRNNTKWEDFSSVEKQAAIIRATDYVDKRFGIRWVGFREQKEQALDWPRSDAFDRSGFQMTGTDDVPRQLQKACAEYALRAAICGVLAPDPLLPVPKQSMESGEEEDRVPAQSGEVSRKSEKVGPIEEETWYDNAASSTELAQGAKSVQSTLVNDFVIPEYPEADLWLEEILKPAHSGVLRRA